MILTDVVRPLDLFVLLASFAPFCIWAGEGKRAWSFVAFGTGSEFTLERSLGKDDTGHSIQDFGLTPAETKGFR